MRFIAHILEVLITCSVNSVEKSQRISYMNLSLGFPRLRKTYEIPPQTVTTVFLSNAIHHNPNIVLPTTMLLRRSLKTENGYLFCAAIKCEFSEAPTGFSLRFPTFINCKSYPSHSSFFIWNILIQTNDIRCVWHFCQTSVKIYCHYLVRVKGM